MNRRSFLRDGAFAGLGIASLFSASCKPSVKNEADQNAFKPFSAPFALDELTVDQLAKKMREGEYSSATITEMYLKRISQIDKSGPILNAVIELNPDALAIARSLDMERTEGKVRGPLHGIPVLIKDNIDTADKMMTTAGALAMVGNFAPHDAYIVSKLRAAGAVLLGKTNLSEWANFRSSRSSSGWSSRGGQTKNPFVLDRSPCGSSSGSGAALSANLCALAIGTETNGSIACPASINGVVGIKPTVGLWSRSGIIPISITQDTAGPMAKTVRDAAIFLGALTGIDPSDPATGKSKGKTFTDYTSFLDSNGLQGKRLGVEKAFLKGHEGVDALIQKALNLMKANGATIIEVDLEKELKVLNDEELKVLKYEFKDGLNKYLASAHAPVKNLQQIIAFNRQHEATAVPWCKQELLEASQALGGLDSKEYADALKKLLNVTRSAIDRTLRDNKLDVICAPTNGPSWCTDLVNGDAFTGYGSYSAAAIAGYPSVTVPMGLLSELPIGITFYGAAWSEGPLLQIAYGFEQHSHHRVTPKFLPHVSF